MKHAFFVILFAITSFLHGVKNPVFKARTFSSLNGTSAHHFDKRTKKMVELFEHNYHEKLGLVHDGFSKAKIPHILHFVWKGQDPLSNTIIEHLDTWKTSHADWKIKLWTDVHCRKCPVPGIEVLYTPDLSLLFPFKVLFEEGGVFVDSSFFCYRSFNCLLVFDFFACLEYSHFYNNSSLDIFPSLALFAAKPSHPIIAHTMALAESQEIHQAFSTACRKYLNHKGNQDMVLPACYFFADKLFPQEAFSYLLNEGCVFARDLEAHLTHRLAEAK